MVAYDKSGVISAPGSGPSFSNGSVAFHKDTGDMRWLVEQVLVAVFPPETRRREEYLSA